MHVSADFFDVDLLSSRSDLLLLYLPLMVRRWTFCTDFPVYLFFSQDKRKIEVNSFLNFFAMEKSFKSTLKELNEYHAFLDLVLLDLNFKHSVILWCSEIASSFVCSLYLVCVYVTKRHSHSGLGLGGGAAILHEKSKQFYSIHTIHSVTRHETLLCFPN